MGTMPCEKRTVKSLLLVVLFFLQAQGTIGFDSKCFEFRGRRALVADRRQRRPSHLVLHPIIRQSSPSFPTRLSSFSKEDEGKSEPQGMFRSSSALLIFGGIPLCSGILTLLLQFQLIAPLVVAKRFYVYALASLVLIVSSLRSSGDSPALGTRLVDLTREMIPSALSSDGQENRVDTRFEALAVLDDTVDDSTQAIGIPLLVVSSLVASFLLASLLRNPPDVNSAQGSSVIINLQEVLTYLITVSNTCVIGLFTRAELARASTPPVASTMIAVAVTLAAFFGSASYVWPLQNCASVCLAIAVARAIQLPRLQPILLALLGLVVYDVVSVGFQSVELGSATLAAASSSGAPDVTTTSQAAATSAMGAVALSKASAGTWQPGLFVVRLRGYVTDLLGLGDAVFPSLLSSFCWRYDQAKNSVQDEKRSKYFIASVLGFVGGCVACEFSPGIGNSGLPALLFLIPSMLLSVGMMGI